MNLPLLVSAVALFAGGALIYAATANPVRTGTASWYGLEKQGQLMANGRNFDHTAMTCAGWDWPLGTILKVTNEANGFAVIVECTDRGPGKELGRLIDLSGGAFSKIADLKHGLITVSVEVVK